MTRMIYLRDPQRVGDRLMLLVALGIAAGCAIAVVRVYVFGQ